MGLINKKGMNTVKLNPSQIFTLFTLPLTYDIKLVSEYISRNTSQLAYEIAFDDYIRFILLETVKMSNSKYASQHVQPHENATFLASDARLNQNARIVNRLIVALGDGSKEHLKGRNFSNLHSDMKEALNIMFENFLLNVTVLQAKMVEFQRWDSNHGDYIPYIIPSLGVFEALLNVKNVHLEFQEDEETGEDIPTQFECLYEFEVPSNIYVGHLGNSACEELYNGIGFPEVELSYFLYKGIYRHAIPTGKYATAEELEVIDEKVNALERNATAIQKCVDTIQELLISHNKTNMPKDQFIAETISLVAELTARGENVPPGYTKLCIEHTKLCELEDARDKLPKLTDKEQSVKLEVDKLRAKPRFKDRYPQLTYDQHINTINSKVLNGEEICKLEESILEVDIYLNLLLRLLQLVGYMYSEKDSIYLLVPKLSQSVALESENQLDEEWDCLTDMIAD